MLYIVMMKQVKKLEESYGKQACASTTWSGVGLYTGVRGTAELLSALSDLYLDTETLDNVQKVLPEIDLNEVYGNEAGGVAKFTSLMTQYGTGFAIAQKIAKEIFGKAVDNKLAKAAAAAAKNKVTQSGVNLAKFGGYWYYLHLQRTLQYLQRDKNQWGIFLVMNKETF